MVNNFFLIIFKNRLLASNKLEMTNEMILKTGNTTLLIKLTDSELDIA
jgi:hypothetical protein